jgi:hypothetical protein
MSLAIAPAIVTWRVPGTTGSVSPCGASAAIVPAIVAPACTLTCSRSFSTASTRSIAVMSSTAPPAFCAASP